MTNGLTIAVFIQSLNPIYWLCHSCSYTREINAAELFTIFLLRDSFFLNRIKKYLVISFYYLSDWSKLIYRSPSISNNFNTLKHLFSLNRNYYFQAYVIANLKIYDPAVFTRCSSSVRLFIPTPPYLTTRYISKDRRKFHAVFCIFHIRRIRREIRALLTTAQYLFYTFHLLRATYHKYSKHSAFNTSVRKYPKIRGRC